MGRTRFRLQTDGQTEGQTDARAIAISPEPFGRGIKISPVQAKKDLRAYAKCADSQYHAHAHSNIRAFTLNCFIL